VTDGVGVAPIDLVLETGADPELVWRTLTDPERVTLWFTKASVLGRPGDTYRLDFGDGTVVSGEILAIEPGRSFSHRWAWEDADTATTTVSWSVEAAGDGARVRLFHDGWVEAGLDASARDAHAGYWSGYLADLRDIFEER